jgi:hypothetical protein
MGFREHDHDADLENDDLKRLARVAELWSELLDLRAKLRQAEAPHERWKTFGGRSDTLH